MLVLTRAQLEQQGITSQELESSPQIKCISKIMERVADFSNQKQDQACELGKSYLKLGIFSFVSESKNGFTVWKEKQSVEKQKITQEIQTKMDKARVNTVANIFNQRKEQNVIKAEGQLKKLDGQLVKRTQASLSQESQSISIEKLQPISQLTALQIANSDQQQKTSSSDISEPQVNQHHEALLIDSHQQLETNHNSQELALLTSSQQKKQKKKYRGVSY